MSPIPELFVDHGMPQCRLRLPLASRIFYYPLHPAWLPNVARAKCRMHSSRHTWSPTSGLQSSESAVLARSRWHGSLRPWLLGPAAEIVAAPQRPRLRRARPVRTPIDSSCSRYRQTDGPILATTST